MIEALMGGSGKQKRLIITLGDGKIAALDRSDGDVLYTKQIDGGGKAAAGIVYDSDSSLIQLVDSTGKLKRVGIDTFSQSSGQVFDSINQYHRSTIVGLSSNGRYASFMGREQRVLFVDTVNNSGAQAYVGSSPYHLAANNSYYFYIDLNNSAKVERRRNSDNYFMDSFTAPDEIVAIATNSTRFFALTIGNDLLVRSSSNLTASYGSINIDSYHGFNSVSSILPSPDGAHVFVIYRLGNELKAVKCDINQLAVVLRITLASQSANYSMSAQSFMDPDGYIYVWAAWGSPREDALWRLDNNLSQQWQITSSSSGVYLSSVGQFIQGNYE